MDFNADYTLIPSAILRDTRISCKARGLYATIICLTKYREMSMAEIREELTEGRESIYSMLSELEKFGYITKKKQVSVNGRFTPVNYVLHSFSLPF